MDRHVPRSTAVYFVNALICGFGAEVTFSTPEAMKRAVGGLAYGITGFFTALEAQRLPGTSGKRQRRAGKSR